MSYIDIIISYNTLLQGVSVAETRGGGDYIDIIISYNTLLQGVSVTETRGGGNFYFCVLLTVTSRQPRGGGDCDLVKRCS